MASLSLLMTLVAVLLLVVAPAWGCEKENCETSNLLQTHRVDAAGAKLEGQSLSFSSPEFLELLPEIDESMKPIETVKVTDQLCMRMVQALKKPHTTMKRQALIHTGIVVPDSTAKGAINIKGWNDTTRKLRLLPLSFLSSQNLENSKLVFWSNVEPTHAIIQEIFGPLLEKYGKYIEIKRFDPVDEFAKIGGSLVSEKSGAELAAELVRIFRSQKEVTSQSDLMRTILLYNYGGAWMDSDVLLVQDLTPLLEEDWAVLMYDNFVNQATLSASQPQSPFIKAWLKNVLKTGVNTDWAQYGPFMVTRMISQIQSSSANPTFHVLPPCFFEGGLQSDAKFDDEAIAGWGEFFGPEHDEKVMKERNYIDPRRNPHSTFGFHWHNRWEKPWLQNSLADASEKLYCEILNVTLS